MKIGISIPDKIFASADKLAGALGLSRSELYATAVAEFLAKHRAGDVTARLNAVYAQQPSALNKRVRRAQARTVRGSEW